MTARTISHYRILGELGAGGMGIVYMAEDERLGRQVALKFLTAESTADATALERFRLEARTASSLSHPGICALYDIGEHEGAPYIVMELLKGESLRERIERGPFKVAEIVDIGIQLADALDAAHKQGIVHRDIKPGNIFLTEKNRPKILDFGLAKLTSTGSLNPGKTTHAPTHGVRPLAANQITVPGTALGTVSYMSPEQARGEDVDERTDIFSLGVVLYEMATGRQAFGGSTTAVAFDGILNRQPPAIAHLNPAMPQRLESVIATAIEKDPDLRFQHAAELQAELKRVRRDLESGSVAGGASRPAIAPANTTVTAVPAASSSAVTPAPRTTFAGVATGLALVVAGGVGVYLWLGGQSAPDTVVVEVAPPSADNARPPEAAPPAATPPPAPAPAVAAPVPAAAKPVSEPGRTRTVSPPPAAPTAAPATTAAVAQPVASEPAPPPAPPPAQPPPRPTDAAPAPAPAPSQPPPAPVQPAATAAPTPAPPSPPPAPQARPAETARPPAASPISDDAAIRQVVASYGRAIETKDVTLFKSLRPSLSAAEETRLRESFRQIASQQVAITISDIKVSGRSATVRLSRTDTIVSDGRRLTQTSQQTLGMSKTGSGWVISEIGR